MHQTDIAGLSATLEHKMFFLSFFTVSGNLLCQDDDHLLQFFVFKDVDRSK